MRLFCCLSIGRLMRVIGAARGAMGTRAAVIDWEPGVTGFWRSVCLALSAVMGIYAVVSARRLAVNGLSPTVSAQQ